MFDLEFPIIFKCSICGATQPLIDRTIIVCDCQHSKVEIKQKKPIIRESFLEIREKRKRPLRNKNDR